MARATCRLQALKDARQPGPGKAGIYLNVCGAIHDTHAVGPFAGVALRTASFRGNSSYDSQRAIRTSTAYPSSKWSSATSMKGSIPILRRRVSSAATGARE